MDMIELANGVEVPLACVEALDKFDREVWAGATFPNARAAIAATVLTAYKEELEKEEGDEQEQR